MLPEHLFIVSHLQRFVKESANFPILGNGWLKPIRWYLILGWSEEITVRLG